MAQTALLIDLVKAALRQRGITYAQIATALDLSESSVKRLFAHKDMPITRLESICGVMNLELADLFELTQSSQRPSPSSPKTRSAHWSMSRSC